MIKQFDKVNLKVLRADIDAALRTVAERHGISLVTKNITYAPEIFTVKVEGAVKVEGETVTREALDFRNYAELYGLKAEHLGKSVRINGGDYRIVGLKTSASKRPVLVERNGQRYTFNANAIAGLLGRE